MAPLKIVVILGATASGKTDVGIALAKKFNGEVVSADSRQVYTKMHVLSATPNGVWGQYEGEERFLVDGVPHYLMDVLDPRQDFSASEFKKLAQEIIGEIRDRGKLPIIVGGTGLYIKSLVDNLNFAIRPRANDLRHMLESKTLPELQSLLEENDPEALKKIDQKNPRRLVRAIEAALSGQNFFEAGVSEPVFDALQIGIDRSITELYSRINERVERQWNGAVEEAKTLIAEDYSFELSALSGIGYEEIKNYLDGEATVEEAKEKMKTGVRRYAKRQYTWFKKDKRIIWVNGKAIRKIEKLVAEFINKKSR